MNRIHWISFIVLAILGFYITSAHAAVTYLKAKQYLDVQSGKFVKPANILIENGRIIAINPTNVPSSAKIMKRDDLILLPGLMDMHVHLPNDFNQQFALQLVQDDDALSTVRGVKNAKKLLMAGFTTVRNLGISPGEGFVDVALAKASEAGWIAAPHIIPAGHALSMTGGHLDPTMFGSYAPHVLPTSYRTGVADGIDEVIKSVRYQIKHGAKVIKVAGTAGVLSEEESVGNTQYSYEELKAIIDEARRHGIPVAVHAHGTEGINAAIKAGARSIEHGSLLNDESIRLMKQYGTYLVSTTYVADMPIGHLSKTVRQKAENLSPLSKQNLQKAIKDGVKVVFGTDSPIVPHGENAKEFSALVRRGMHPIDAIRSATIHAAELMNLQDRGQIKVGHHADIIGVKDDPLTKIQTLETVSFVMKDGDVFKG